VWSTTYTIVGVTGMFRRFDVLPYDSSVSGVKAVI